MNTLTVQKRSIVDLDGFNDFTNESEGDDGINTSSRVIQGEKIKYLMPRWLLETTRDVTGWLFTAIGVVNVVNKWAHDHKPLVTRILAPGEKFPDFDKLNDECPRSEWRTAFGKETGPWSGQHCIYLIDENLNRFTWPSPTKTIGSAIAVRELVDQIKLVRKFRGENVYPVVELSLAPFKTAYGDRERPHLPIKRWVTLGPDRAGALPAPDAPVLSGAGSAPAATQGAPADAQVVEPLTAKEVTGDEIKY